MISFSGTSKQRARTDTTGLLVAKWIELGTGERDSLFTSMAHISEDAERCSAVCLTLLNLVAQYATSSGRDLNGLRRLIDYLIKQMEEGNRINE